MKETVRGNIYQNLALIPPRTIFRRLPNRWRSDPGRANYAG
jgi:hypothetical protein